MTEEGELTVVIQSEATSEEWKRARQTVVALLKQCAGNIQRGFVAARAFDDIHRIVLARTLRQVGRTTRFDPYGFALLTRVSSSEWHIKLICATEGRGRSILSFVEKLALEAGVDSLSLDALPSVVNYYRKIGYRNTEKHTCEEDDDVANLATQVSHLKLATNQAAVSDPLFAPFLGLLVTKGLTADKQCKAAAECSRDGFVMRKCLIPKKKSPTKKPATPKKKKSPTPRKTPPKKKKTPIRSRLRSAKSTKKKTPLSAKQRLRRTGTGTRKPLTTPKPLRRARKPQTITSTLSPRRTRSATARSKRGE